MELLKSLCQEQEIHWMVIKYKSFQHQTNMTFKWVIFHSYITAKKTVAFCARY